MPIYKVVELIITFRFNLVNIINSRGFAVERAKKLNHGKYKNNEGGHKMQRFVYADSVFGLRQHFNVEEDHGGKLTFIATRTDRKKTKYNLTMVRDGEQDIEHLYE